jgi:hypothetical protein
LGRDDLPASPPGGVELRLDQEDRAGQVGPAEVRAAQVGADDAGATQHSPKQLAQSARSVRVDGSTGSSLGDAD